MSQQAKCFNTPRPKYEQGVQNVSIPTDQSMSQRAKCFNTPYCILLLCLSISTEEMLKASDDGLLTRRILIDLQKALYTLHTLKHRTLFWKLKAIDCFGSIHFMVWVNFF